MTSGTASGGQTRAKASGAEPVVDIAVRMRSRVEVTNGLRFGPTLTMASSS
jgi:hypothetical protein